MEALFSIGMFTFVVGILAIALSVVIFLWSSISRNKKIAKNGLYILIFGSITLLASFTLCTTVGIINNRSSINKQ